MLSLRARLAVVAVAVGVVAALAGCGAPQHAKAGGDAGQSAANPCAPYTCSPIPQATAAPTPPSGFDLLPPSGQNDTALFDKIYASCNWSYSTTAGCEAASISALQTAMAGEGLTPMTFPADFWSLPYTGQELVLVNGERTARDLAPVQESPQLDQMAEAGAEAHADPTGPADVDYGATWAGAENTVYNDFWMVYNDGYGSNQDCAAGNTSGCWGHRESILAAAASYFGSACVAEPKPGYLPLLSCGELLSPVQ
jgi:hypothetical protein